MHRVYSDATYSGTFDIWPHNRDELCKCFLISVNNKDAMKEFKKIRQGCKWYGRYMYIPKEVDLTDLFINYGFNIHY